MRFFIAVILCCILFAICWPFAIVILFLFPLIWLILLPLRILGFAVEGVMKLIRELFLLPFRIVKSI